MFQCDLMLVDNKPAEPAAICLAPNPALAKHFSSLFLLTKISAQPRAIIPTQSSQPFLIFFLLCSLPWSMFCDRRWQRPDTGISPPPGQAPLPHLALPPPGPFEDMFVTQKILFRSRRLAFGSWECCLRLRSWHHQFSSTRPWDRDL